MKGVILQPGYFPWLGFFNQMIVADLFIYLDDVQYDRRGWRNRNRISGNRGPQWLTVPVIQKGLYLQAINETRIDNTTDWADRHLTTLRHAYGKAPHFEIYFPEIQKMLETPRDLLVDLDYAVIDMMRKWLEIDSPLMKSSDFTIATEDKTGRLVELCSQTGITDYISGPLCRNYMDYEQLRNRNITLWLHEYHHPEYRQTQKPFTPFLSAVDLLFFEGPGSREILVDRNSLVPFESDD